VGSAGGLLERPVKPAEGDARWHARVALAPRSSHALSQVEAGEKVTEICWRLGVTEQTFYR
jgi:hypothetical protein